MSPRDMKIIAPEAERLIAMSAGDAELRAALRALAEDILEATDGILDRKPDEELVLAGSIVAASPAGESLMGADIRETRPPAPDPDEPAPVRRSLPPPEPLRELTLGRSPAPPPPTPSAASSHDEPLADELEQLQRRCRAKCEAVRWQAECHRRLWEGVESPIEDVPVDPEMVEWSGRLVDCFYWLDSSADSSQSTDISLLDDVAGCFESLAAGIALMPSDQGRRGKLERLLPLLAEAQSMLRQALQRLGAPGDPDQLAVYQIVRDAAARHRYFVRKYMRADDPANPSAWPGLLSRIEAMAASGQPSRQQQQRLDRLREHLRPIGRGEGSDKDWQAIIDLVEESIDDGIPPSNREIRELLLPVIDDLPDREDLPPGFRLVLREMDRYLATRIPTPRAGQSYVPPPEVKQAARLLEGRSVVLIGGIRRRESQQALRKALALKDLIWIETKEHQSIEPFEPVVARPDVALVLLAIRWSSHAFGDVRQFCVRHGKPLVRLPGGYGPHQVAVQVLAQASEVLGAEG